MLMLFQRTRARGLCCAITISTILSPVVFGQSIPMTWEQTKSRFLVQNPSIMAGEINIQEARANEVTAGLRPNPQLGVTLDQIQLLPGGGPWRPLSTTQFAPIVSQLIERQNKRGLRVQSARLATAGTGTDQEDLKRTLMFILRSAFVGTLQARALVDLTEDNLKYYDNVIDVNRERFKAGDISELDFQRVDIQRVQFESDLVTARVNLRTAKIQLLSLLNDRTPVDSFDVTGSFEYQESVHLLPELRQQALRNRPDLRSAANAIEKARADNRLAFANGSADPTVGGEYLWNQGVNNTLGVVLSVPLRIFDRNQGEKERTALEIRRTQSLRNALEANIYRDVDSAWETLESVRVLARPYHDKYLKEAADIREKVSLSYSLGGSTLLDFLDAQRSYRGTQVTYLNLVGSYLSTLAQISLATGQEVN